MFTMELFFYAYITRAVVQGERKLMFSHKDKSQAININIVYGKKTSYFNKKLVVNSMF